MGHGYLEEDEAPRLRFGGKVLLIGAAILIVAVAVMFVMAVVQDIQNLDRFGTIEPARADNLLNLMVMILSVLILCFVIRDVSKGGSLFTSANTERFLIIGIMIVLKIIVSIVVQISIFAIYPGLNHGLAFPIDVILSGFMIFMLYYICKQGSRLQEDVENIV